jgi:hypothetical protein
VRDDSWPSIIRSRTSEAFSRKRAAGRNVRDS